MAHTTEIVETKQIADELFAVRFRCCGDEKTDSWHTMHTSVVTDSGKLADSLSWKHSTVAANHEAANVAAAYLQTLIGTSVDHK